MKGARIVTECLQREGVEYIFGYPGGTVIDLYDALFENTSITHVLVRHEQGAVHAADGYARTTGKPGVCLATSGPGATNLVTGLTNAYMDSIPVVAITGQVPTRMIGKDAFQEADTTGITMPVTKHNFLVTDVRQLAQIIREAFYLAQTGRPGPVLIDLPRDIQMTETEFIYPEKLVISSYRPTYRGHGKQISLALKALQEAEKPLLYVGGGILASGASGELLEFAERCQIPVTYTLMGKGGFPESHPLSLGWLGMHGMYCANKAIMNCDLLIAVGTRFDDRVTGNTQTFARQARIIHVDIDPAEIGKNVPVDVPIVGDARNILTEFLKTAQSATHPDWLSQITQWKEEYSPCRSASEDLLPHQVVETVYAKTGPDSILVTDVGQHQMWAGQLYKVEKPRTWASSGGLGTMGYGLPAAVGAQIGNPEKRVVLFSGDGSILMKIQELVTAVNYCLPLKIFVLNNSFLGMVRQWQACFYEGRYSCTHLKNPDLAGIARAFGAEGISVQTQQELEQSIDQALQITDRPVLVDCRVAREECVFPFVPPGKSLDEMILE